MISYGFVVLFILVRVEAVLDAEETLLSEEQAADQVKLDAMAVAQALKLARLQAETQAKFDSVSTRTKELILFQVKVSRYRSNPHTAEAACLKKVEEQLTKAILMSNSVNGYNVDTVLSDLDRLGQEAKDEEAKCQALQDTSTSTSIPSSKFISKKNTSSYLWFLFLIPVIVAAFLYRRTIISTCNVC